MKKILIIEDDSFLSDLESLKFSHEGFLVTVAKDSSEIHNALSDSSPDIILLDLMLPGVDTFELLKTLKEDQKTKSIPVIVFSNISDDEKIKKHLDAGASEYMIKSNFTLTDVIEKVHTIIK